MKKLEKYLSDGTDSQKLQTIKKLASLKSKDAGKVLFHAYKTETNGELKSKIKKALDYIKQNLKAVPKVKPIDDEMIDNIIEAYQSSDPLQEKKALEFIVKRQAHELIPELIDFAEERDEAEFIIRVIRVCSRIQTKDFSTDVVGFLNNENPQVVFEVISYFEQRKTIKNNLKSLKSILLNPSKKLSSYVLKLISDLANSGVEAAGTLLKEHQEDLIKKKRASIPNYVPTEVDPDLLPTRKSDKIKVKKEKASVQSKEKVVLYRLKTSLDSKDANERIDAIKKIAATNDPEAIDLIYQKLGTETLEEVLASVLNGLGVLKAESALSSIIGYLEHENINLRYEAAKAMNLILGLEKVKPAMEKLLRDENNQIKSIAIQGLFYSQPNECFLPLTSLADPKNIEKSLACMDCLEIFQDDKHLTMMHKFFHSDLSEIKSRAQLILNEWQGDNEISKFILKDSDENFTQFYKSHLEKTKQKQAKEIRAAEEQEAEEQEAAEKEAKGSFFSNILKKFKK
ncbi:MAG: hypothetical protein COB02_15395 [Candidatus Cloacimonadota bacterium]|nr:MAG: hypothetical protein COB02_15395 [Candidatus Cloacimonadota bacterium]